jgi:alkylation response protein AidB-like acyl-CoA dehydrogenase
MNFALTADQAMIRDAAQSFLADASGSAAVRAAAASDSGFDAGTWNHIGAELGWCAIPVSEAHGGLGLGAVELALVLEQMGRQLLCAPYFSTVCLAANLLQQVGNEAAQRRFLPEIAAGKLCLSAPLGSGADEWSGTAAVLRAKRSSGRWVLSGSCPRLPDAQAADYLLLPGQIEGEPAPAWFAVPRDAAGLELEFLQGWDATRRFAKASLEEVKLEIEQRIDDPSRIAAGLPRAVALARLAIAAEQLGGAQQCLDLTVAYTATRRQFGRAIASFQAVKHRCAEMMVRIEATRSAVYGAAAAAGSEGGDALILECAAARALASDTFFYCAQEAIQLHGGVGFTWEYDPQLYFKRAQASSHWLGSADALRERIAQALLA